MKSNGESSAAKSRALKKNDFGFIFSKNPVSVSKTHFLMRKGREIFPN